MPKCFIFDIYNVLYPYSSKAEEVVLEVEKRGYQVAAISSLGKQTVDEVCLHYGFAHCFSATSLRLSKTDSEIYQKFLTEAGLNGLDCVMIDDNLDNLEAARSLGIITVWLKIVDRNSDFQPDYEIGDLKELLEIKF